MNNYNKPQMDIVNLTTADVVTVSGFGNTTDWQDPHSQEQ